MAELTATDVTTHPCCEPERQDTCCRPSAKADCCGEGGRCGCAPDAGALQLPTVPESGVFMAREVFDRA